MDIIIGQLAAVQNVTPVSANHSLEEKAEGLWFLVPSIFTKKNCNTDFIWIIKVVTQSTFPLWIP